MNVENRVFSRLFKEDKTELDTQKIKLSVIDDIDAKMSKALKESLNGSKLAKQSIAAYNSAAQLYAEAESLANKAIPQAKDLGANQLVKELQGNAKNISSDLKRASKTADKIKSSI
jgi:isopentenyl diphosphate isomerase/L-lactate dehydrogenase-like FMN-dependent dehydrogenase